MVRLVSAAPSDVRLAVDYLSKGEKEEDEQEEEG